MTFQSLGLAAELLNAVEQTGYTVPTPVQMLAIPAAIAGQDLLVSSHTGSGKTAAFTLPALQKIIDRRPTPGSGPRVLVLTPTRELAQQVEKAVQTYGKALRWLNTACLVGGAPMFAQIKQLQRQCDVVVATPGRLLDHLNRRKIKLSDVEVLILDEADRMLDMGFYADITTVVEQCPEQRQTLLFSATYPDDIDRLAKRFMREPQMVQVAAQHSAHKIEQRWYEVPAKQKVDVVVQMLAHFRPESSIVFCNTKQQCRDVVTELQAQGISALALFGELEQRERDEVLVQFANRSCSVLVATDVAARGLDIANLACVINVDVTPDAEVHIHRIGRTGRGDAEGLALNLVAMDEMPYVAKIEQLQGRPSEWLEVAELTPAPGGPLLPPMMTIQIIGGRKEKIRAGDVLGAMCADFGYAKDQIGKISVNDFSTYVAVDRRIAAEACAKLNNGRVKGKSVRARVL